MRFPEEHCFLEGSKAWPDCPSGKRNIYIDEDEHGALVEWYWQGRTRSTRRKQIPQELSWDRARSSAVRSGRLTSWAMAQRKLLWSYAPARHEDSVFSSSYVHPVARGRVVPATGVTTNKQKAATFDRRTGWAWKNMYGYCTRSKSVKGSGRRR